MAAGVSRILVVMISRLVSKGGEGLRGGESHTHENFESGKCLPARKSELDTVAAKPKPTGAKVANQSPKCPEGALGISSNRTSIQRQKYIYITLPQEQVSSYPGHI